MLRVGLTGGIGSGKTMIAKIFSTLGAPVYDADSAAKKLMEANEDIQKKIVTLLGPEVFQNQKLNKGLIASMVFSNKEKLNRLNEIVHPATIKDAEAWFSQQTAPYAIKEAALIFESGSHQYLDYMIGVWAPEHLRLERALSRGGITPKQVKERMQQQMDEKEKMKLCHFVIDNSGSDPVIPQVFKLHHTLKNMAPAGS